MREFVYEDEVARADQRRDNPRIGKVAGAEDAGRLRPLMRARRFEVCEQRMIAGDAPRAPAPTP
jgi:hypothetical protein